MSGKGSADTLESESDVASPAAIGDSRFAPPPAGWVPRGPLHVMVVEDDSDYVQLLSELVRVAFPSGTTVEFATSLAGACEGLSKMKADLVLLDLNLPDSTGVESVCKLRRVRGDVAVVVVTGMEDKATELDCLDEGIEYCISKSDLGAKLLRRVAVHAIERHRLRLERARALERERELLRVVDSAGEAIVVWDLEGRIVSCNPSARNLYGFGEGEVAGLPIGSIVPEERQVQFQETVQRARGGERSSSQGTTRLRLSGSEAEVDETIVPIEGPDGTVLRIASIARDCSQIAHLKSVVSRLAPSPRPVDVTSRLPSLDPGMRRVYELADLVALDPGATILLLGETGVGKGWLAQYIHARRTHGATPFVEVSGCALASQLIESELFGHERGAFTGAMEKKYGLVETAEGGTLFLDEIGELPIEVQARFLAFLDSHEFRRVGGTRRLTAHVRVIAATNRDLQQEVQSGRFRSDLYFRLNVFPIRIPPLRERPQEIPTLVQRLLAEIGRVYSSRAPEIDQEALSLLASYHWPGNIRELRNTLERALILTRGGKIGPQDLSIEIRGGDGGREVSEGTRDLEDVIRRHIRSVLDATQGNKSRAASILGISRARMSRHLAARPADEEGSAEEESA